MFLWTIPSTTIVPWKSVFPLVSPNKEEQTYLLLNYFVSQPESMSIWVSKSLLKNHFLESAHLRLSLIADLEGVAAHSSLIPCKEAKTSVILAAEWNPLVPDAERTTWPLSSLNTASQDPLLVSATKLASVFSFRQPKTGGVQYSFFVCSEHE
jgi:hypothetical protein